MGSVRSPNESAVSVFFTVLDKYYAFWEPVRPPGVAVGGDKTGADRWYETFVALADRIYDEHLRELRKEDKL